MSLNEKQMAMLQRFAQLDRSSPVAFTESATARGLANRGYLSSYTNYYRTSIRSHGGAAREVKEYTLTNKGREALGLPARTGYP